MEHRISLNKRLEQAGAHSAVPLNAFELFPDDYFYAFAELTGNPGFKEVFRKHVRKYTHQREHFPVLSELIFYAGELPCEQQQRLLFHILIEPFAVLNRKEKPTQ